MAEKDNKIEQEFAKDEPKDSVLEADLELNKDDTDNVTGGRIPAN